MFSSEFISKALHLDQKLQVSAFRRIWTDSRTTKKADLFASISGENFNGHDFIFEAFKKGAVGALVSQSNFKEKDKLPKDFCLIEVQDTVQALRKIAKAHRENLTIPVLAIAGSNGKTTTKEWIWHFLSRISSENIFKTLRSQNSILGIALSLLQIRDEKIAIIEIGIDEKGWMDQHLEIVQPTHGIITTISEEHLQHLKDIETIAQEELKLLNYLNTKKGAFAANLDCAWITKSKIPADSLTYSLSGQGDIAGSFSFPQSLSAFGINWHNPLPGKHNAQNLLAALTAVRLLRPDLKKDQLTRLAETTKSFEGEAHRSRWITLKNKLKVYDDSYNANPSSMEIAISTFLELSNGKSRHLVIGDMLDLGEKSKSLHKKVLDLLTKTEFKKAYLLGENFSACKEALKDFSDKIQFFTSYENLEKEVCAEVNTKDSVLLKGSRGMALERLLTKLEAI